MDSEHKHELKTNDLAKQLMSSGDYVKAYGGRIFLGIAIVILAYVLITQRMGKSRVMSQKHKEDLSEARSIIDRLTNLSQDQSGQPSVLPRESVSVVPTLEAIVSDGSDRTVVAQAQLALGDYAWAMAHYPEITITTTQPSVTYKPDRPKADLLKDAKAAYEKVTTDFADEKQAVVAARFGLAAIAEQAGDWAAAEKNYKAVTDLADAPAFYKQWAESKVARLDTLKKPALIGKPDTRPVMPDLEEVLKKAATQMSTRPTTAPTPTVTRPTTVPTTTAPTVTTTTRATTRPATTQGAK